MRQNKTYNSAETKPSRFSIVFGIIACVCIVAYLGSIVFAGIRVYNSISERHEIAMSEFANVISLSSRLLSEEDGDTDFEVNLARQIASSQTLQALIISGSWGFYIGERDAGRIISWNGDTPGFNHNFGLSREPLSRMIPLSGEMATIEAVYTYIDYDLLVTLLQRTILVVIAALSLAIFALVSQHIMVKPRDKSKEEPSSYPEPQEENNATTPNNSSNLIITDISKIYKSRPKESSRQDNKEKESHSDEPKERILSEDSLPKLMRESPKEPSLKESLGRKSLLNDKEEAKSSIIPKAETKSPAASGFSEKLEAEIKRSVSSEQDLVFMFVEIKESENEKSGMRFLHEEAVKLFLRRDHIFENGDNSIAVILPGIDLDQGFAKSEKLLNRIVDKYNEAFNKEVKVYMGLSSRADRSIDAERLTFEASGALKKAYEDPESPIVAFRSDPEKYKAFIASQKKMQV